MKVIINYKEETGLRDEVLCHVKHFEILFKEILITYYRSENESDLYIEMTIRIPVERLKSYSVCDF